MKMLMYAHIVIILINLKKNKFLLKKNENLCKFVLKDTNASNESQDEYLKIIIDKGNLLMNIINDIISISKIESGLVEVNLQKSNIVNPCSIFTICQFLEAKGRCTEVHSFNYF